MIRRRLRVTGKVQGVWYRAWFRGQAEALGLAGWVRNRHDGSVEALVEGAAAQVAEIVARARVGSPASQVADVQVGEEADATPLHGFVQRETA